MKILIGFDGSPSARAALDAVLGMPWPKATQVRGIVALGDLAGSPPALRAILQEALREQAEEAERKLRERWPAASVRVVADGPVQALEAEARRMRPDLTVVGWRGHGRFRRLLAGSVSRRLAERSKGAVMVARDPLPSRKPRHRYVLGYDGSKNARAALRLLSRLEPPRGARVLLLGALPPLYSPPLARLTPQARQMALAQIRKAEAARARSAKLRLDRAARQLAGRGWRVRTAISEQGPLFALLEAARSFGADALLVGARAVSGVERLLLGSVAAGALDRAGCPVIVAR